MINNQEENNKCSFCGGTLSSNSYLTGINDRKLCFNCVFNSKEILDKKVNEEKSKSIITNLKQNIKLPREIFNYLNEYVIGQEKAKKSLAVAVYNHFNRLINNLGANEVEIEKSNILLIGPSGSGKTLLAKTLAKILQVPFVITDATTLTEAGYVGDDVENILLRLIEKADHNIELAEKGIVFIDEIDKIGRKSESTSITRDVSGEGVQQALLKIIEGTISSVPLRGGRKHPQSQNIKINTKDILFICGGAFIGIDKIVENRVNKSTIGFKKNSFSKEKNGKILEKINQDDVIKYGIIPELVGRLPVITSLNQLSKKELKKIILEPKNSLIAQFRKLLAYNDITLKINNRTIDFLIEKSSKAELGARGLKSILEDIMEDITFLAPENQGKTIKLTPENIQSKKFF